MIRFTDAITLAYTKLRTHRVRTGFTVGIAGVLFGLILAVLFFVQGVFDSVGRFSDVGLNNRTILSISYYNEAQFNQYNYGDDPAFVAEVEKAYKQLTAKKAAAAKKYNVSYDASVEDPSPIGYDNQTKKKYITIEGLGSSYVNDIAKQKRQLEEKFDINKYLSRYKTANVLPANSSVGSDDSSLAYMKNNKEIFKLEAGPSRADNDPVLTIMNGSIAKPFITDESFDPSKGEIPVVLPYSQAEKLLGLKSLEKSASNQAKLDRMHEVRDRLSEVSAAFCYRNQASAQLLSTAVAQYDDMKKNQGTAGYIEPSLVYTLPSETSCGAVAIAKDNRTLAEKDEAKRYVQYEKEIGTYLGEPKQQKITVRAVGLSSDGAGESSLSSVGEMVNGLLGSSLGYGTWTIPADMLKEVPQQYRPGEVFPVETSERSLGIGTLDESFMGYLVEFQDKDEARDVLQRTGTFSGTYSGGVSAFPFGSGTLIVDEMRRYFDTFMFWTLVIVGGVAAIILGGIIARTVSEGRRESAVFRAIGAKRVDIAGIYGVYALLLAVRVVIFAVVLGAVVAGAIELLFADDATVGARVAYAAVDTTVEFHLFGIGSWYIPIVLAVIIVVSLLGSIIPIIRNARRNPINDMRDE